MNKKLKTVQDNARIIYYKKTLYLENTSNALLWKKLCSDMVNHTNDQVWHAINLQR